jgi:hypothetical protein
MFSSMFNMMFRMMRLSPGMISLFHLLFCHIILRILLFISFPLT